MKNRWTVVFVVFLSASLAQAQSIDTVFAKQLQPSDDRYEKSIEAYQSAEAWTLWCFPMDNQLDTAEYASTGTMGYGAQNINDQDLKTNWSADSVGKIEFKFHYHEYEKYGSAYQFFGQINLFNGNCSSLETWLQEGRIKLLRVYLNDHPICFVSLLDTWQFQYFNLDHYFKNRYGKRYLNAPYEIGEGDRLTFEVVEVYEGEESSQAKLSEFMIQGAGN